MKTYNKQNIIYLILFSIGLIMSGCEKDEESPDMPDTLFSPLSFSTSVNGVDATFSWVPIANANYILEISRDSLLFVNDLQIIEIEDAIKWKVVDLFSNSRYSARIKSVSKDGTVKDSRYCELTFETGTENIFYAATENTVGLDFIKIEWNTAKKADKVVISAVDGTIIKTVVLSSTELEAGELLFENLDEGTTFKLQIFNGNQLRGTMSLSTYPALSTIKLDLTIKANEGWHALGSYYLLANSGAFGRIKNDGTVGYVIADAFKFSKGDYEIIVDNTDEGVTKVGSWTASTGYPTRIGINYYHDGNSSKGEKSITYTPIILESGIWTVSVFSYSSSALANNVPIDIYAGDH